MYKGKEGTHPAQIYSFFNLLTFCLGIIGIILGSVAITRTGSVVERVVVDDKALHLSVEALQKKLEDLQATPSVFTPAPSLDDLRNAGTHAGLISEIPADSFQWIAPQEIVPGGTTCGFMHARLGFLADQPYPTVKVYMCMHFAEIQPAPKGTMFMQ